MIAQFDEIPAQVQPRCKSGAGEPGNRIYADEMGRILQLALPAGASIAPHTHKGGCEVTFFLSGSGLCIDEGAEFPVMPGLCHYCPGGHSHSIINTGAEPLVLLSVALKPVRRPVRRPYRFCRSKTLQDFLN